MVFNRKFNRIGISAAILLFGIFSHNSLKAEDVIPYVVKNKKGFVFSYFTGKSCQTAIFFSNKKRRLESLDNSHIEKLEKQKLKPENDLFGYMVLTKPGGSTDWSLKVPFKSTYHRIKVDPVQIKKFYSIYTCDGKFSRIFPGPDNSGKLKNFALINHTRAELLSNGKYKFYDEALINNILHYRPQYLFHSGDIINSVYNIELLKEESLNVFRNLAPFTPIIFSFSNHDIGWPLTELNYSPSRFLKFFFPFDYVDNTAHHITFFDNVIVLSIEYVSISANKDVHIIDDIVDTLKRYKKPVIILTGGRTHIEQLNKMINSLPQIKVVIGGDGGEYREIELNNSVKYIYLRHFDMFAVAHIRDDTMFLEVRTSKRLYKNLEVQL